MSFVSERGLIGWTTTLYVAGILPQYLVGSLAVQIRESFAFSDATLGATVGISFTVAALTSALAGRGVSRFGIRRSLAAVGLVFVAVPVAIAAFAESGLMIVLAMAVMGLASGTVSPATAALFTSEIRSSTHGTAFGLLSAAPSLAAFGAGLALPLIATPIGWRAAFALAAALAAASLFVVLRFPLPGRPTLESRPTRKAGRRTGSMVKSAVSAGLASGAGLGMRSFLVVYAVSIGIHDSLAGLLLAASGILAVASRIVMGMLGDRRPGNSLFRAAALMAISAAGYLLMVTGAPPLVIAGAFLAGGIGWGWNAPLSLAAVTENPDAPASAIAAQMTGFFVGAATGPVIVGLLAEHVDYALPWLACAVSVGAGALLLWTTGRRPKASNA